ncbi:SDR family oxidoreductase [Pseudomonas sp. 3JA]
MIKDHTSLGRFGETSDIAAVVAYLAFDESRWVTAQVIEVSSGYKL